MGNRLCVRARKAAAEKTVRAMVLRKWELTRFRRSEELERVPLEKPVFWGYRRRLILRKDIAARKDADRLLELLVVVQKEEDCRRKDFKRWDKQTHRWETWEHRPRKLWRCEYERLPSYLKPYFESYLNDRHQLRYRIALPWMFESRRSKLYLTHRFLPNVEREREVSYLSARIEQGQLMGIYAKVSSRRSYWSNCYNDDKRKLQAKIHRQEIAAGYECHAAGKLLQERGKEVNEDAKKEI